ncbi:hypothetical protein J6X04_00440 [Candidatus Saccharibacteria bacterium]|nr:hypothetical protein [Candidatus Saccharibacteria bacterium]
MSKFNNPNTSDYKRLERILNAMMPDPTEFGYVYPKEEISSDKKQLEAFKYTPEYKKGQERSDAKLLEKTFTDMLERGDWFGEFDLYGDDDDFFALKTFPTAEIDDAFNHIDVICMINNPITNHETLPFAVDLTYNTDSDKMARKFRWKHVYGKKKSAPEGVSEFGESYVTKNHDGEEVLKTRPLPLKFRNGLKIPGFASAKYFEDKDDIWNPVHEKGRIPIMPRFIVGYSPDIASVLASGMPDEQFRQKYGEQEYQARRQRFQSAERRAKWCTLLECYEQASNIRYMLEHMDEEETKWMSPEELEEAKKQIIMIEEYFTKAIKLATEKAQTDPDEMSAMQYADRDVVRLAIIEHSSNTYLAKAWE